MGWERVREQVGPDETPSGPGKRWGHTCNAIKDGRFLYVFGGFGKNNRHTNEVHVFDTATEKWSQPVMKGTAPLPRDSHTCTTVGDNLFVFGGTDGMNPFKDLHILETSSNTWICASVRGEGPEAREGHGAAVVGKRLFIFGGCGRSSSTNVEIYYNDLYILNTETLVWKRAITTGNPPSRRDNHTCSSYKNKIIVIGGEDEHDFYLSDVHILDTDTLFWKELHTSGKFLSPRAGHSTVAFGRNLFVFGGFADAQNLYNDLYVLDVETGVWSKVLPPGEGPSARFSASGDSLDPCKRGVLVFLGGCNKNLAGLDDMYYLCTVVSRDERDLGMPSLKKQKCQEQSLVILDGKTGSEKLSPDQPQFLQEKRSFRASVTGNLPLGYRVETTIDGKLLHGVVWTDKPGSVGAPTDPRLSRKRSARSGGGLTLTGNIESKSKARKRSKNVSMGSQQADETCIAKESSSHGREVALDPSGICLTARPLNYAVAAANPSDVLNAKAVESHELEIAAATDAKTQLHSDVLRTDKESSSHGREAAVDSSDVHLNARSSDETEAAANPSSVLNANAVESQEPEIAAITQLHSDAPQTDKESSSHGREAAVDSSDVRLNARNSDETEAAANPSSVLNANAVESQEPEIAAKTQLHSDVLQTNEEPVNLEPSSSLALLNLNDQIMEADEYVNEQPVISSPKQDEQPVISTPKQDEALEAAERREDDPAESAHQ